MKLDLKQTKLAGLTMQLDLKAMEYKELCDKFEKLEADGINPNDPILLVLREDFIQNNKEIEEINRQLTQLKSEEDLDKQEGIKQYDGSNLFVDKNEDTGVNQEEVNIVPNNNNGNIFSKVRDMMRKIFGG